MELKIWLVYASGSIISWENKKQVEKTLIQLKKKIILWCQHTTPVLKSTFITKIKMHLSLLLLLM